MSFLPTFDKPLVGRVKKYLSENRHVTIEEMAEDLQLTYYKDYGRRKRNDFKKLVKLTHQHIMQERKLSKGNQAKHKDGSKRRKITDQKDSDTNSDSDKEILVEYNDNNSLNSSVMQMYKKMKRQSLSAPSSPFSYVDRPMVSGDQKIIEDKMDQAPDYDVKFDPKDKNNVSEAQNGISSEKSSNVNMLSTPSENLSSNIVSPDTFLSGKRVEKTSKSRSSKKKKNLSKGGLGDDFDAVAERSKTKFTPVKSDVKFCDIGGIEYTFGKISNLLMHIKHPEVDKALGVIPPRGVLLHGPPGCGKSLLANAIAGELNLPMLKIVATEIVSGVSGESEQKLRDMFEVATSSAPCIIFIDEIDAITPKRELASKDMERRIVAQLLACLDDLKKSSSQILVIGATNRPDAIDPALRRAGRFDKEICLGIPDEKARFSILKVLCKNMKLEPDFNFFMLARLTPGYVGADLMLLCSEAASLAFNRVLQLTNRPDSKDKNMEVENETDGGDSSLSLSSNHTSSISSSALGTSDLSYADFLHWLQESAPLSDEQLRTVCIEFRDFENAIPNIQPSAKREGFATVPDVTWDDIGALENIREELTMAILAPVRNPEVFSAMGLTRRHGILLAGPPGCGKTLLAKAIASESGINFISVKGPELLNMYVGESERAVRQCFERARNSSPCVVFFDELDSLCPTRSGSESASTSRVVNQMLTEMDGLQARGNVFVMAATNRPDIIDPAVLRPGRLDKTLYVGLPSADDRVKILRTLTKSGTKPPICNNVSMGTIASDERCARFTGADMSLLVQEATVNAIRGCISGEHVLSGMGVKTSEIRVTQEDFEKAWKKVKPSVSRTDELRYEKMRMMLEKS